MTNYQPLNPEHHQQLRYAESYGPEFGHNVGAVMVLPNEFSKVQREFPILFRKNPHDGTLFPVALLGLEERENLFLDENSNWISRYIPLSMRKGPFLIGLQEQGEENRLIAFVDTDDTRLSQEKGLPLFNDDGTSSSALIEVRGVLSALHLGSEQLPLMMDAFLKHELLEQVLIEIDLNDGGMIKFDAGYTVNIDKLFSLKDESVVELHKSGLLGLAYNVAESVNNIQRLIDIKNAKHR